MKKSDESRPEPVLFLLEAADAMRKYHALHGRYPGEWHLLDIEFANGPYRVNDPGTRPLAADKNRWRPRECEYTYSIDEAGEDGFLIRAVNDEGVAEYEIDQDAGSPRRLLADEFCTAEQPRGKQLPEAAVFLNAAASKFEEYHQRIGRYPDSWDALDFHWALVEHRATDEGVKPPGGCGAVWKPLGASYSYEITRADEDHYAIRSRNTEGLEDYRISSEETAPVPVDGS